MTDNQTNEAITVTLLVVFLAALVWAIRRSATPLLVLNALAALAIIVYDVNPLRYILEDWRLQAIVAWEALGFVAALLALRGNRPALVFSYASFAVHVGMIAFAVYLAFFFRITRLI
jgi:hypothetical protein